MDDCVLFSVCIPVYNVENYLSDCIDSVLAQTEKSVEILLVDDGSRDASGEICDRYAAQYPNVRVKHKENAGLVMARYDAVHMARGRYLTFLDSDDLYEPETLQRLRQVIAETQAELVIFDLCRVYPDGRKKLRTEPYENLQAFTGMNKRRIYQDLVEGNSLNSLCRKCMKRELYPIDMDAEAYRGIVQGEDKLISLSCVDAAETIVYLKESLYRYRMNPGSSTNNVTLKSYRDVQLVHAQVERYIEKWKLPDSCMEKLLCRRLHVAQLCVRRQAGRSKRELQAAVDYIASDPAFLRALKSIGPQGYAGLICRCIKDKRVFLLRLLVSVENGRRTAKRIIGR